MKIQVTQQDIDAAQGMPGCPIWQAMMRLLPVHTVRVQSDSILTSGCKPIILPQIAKDFITQYDTGTSVKPFEFEIDWEPRACA